MKKWIIMHFFKNRIFKFLTDGDDAWSGDYQESEGDSRRTAEVLKKEVLTNMLVGLNKIFVKKYFLFLKIPIAEGLLLLSQGG